MSAPDPVKDKSSFLCMYMSNHPDTLVAYVRHFGHVTSLVDSASMVSIDSKGMDLKYRMKGQEKDKGEEVRVLFDPPLAGYEEVKPRLLAMTADAQEALGMTKAPQISTFHFPPRALIQTGPLLLLLTYCTISPLYSTSGLGLGLGLGLGNASPWALGQWLYDAVGGKKTIMGIWAFVVVVHGLEALYMDRLCRKHRTGFWVGAKYVLSTYMFGFPVIASLRAKIQKARIDSIMKGQ